MWWNLRSRLIATTSLCREGEGGSGGAGGEGGAGGDVPALNAPWGPDINAQWQIGESGKQQPWYMALPDGPTKDFVKGKNYANPGQMADALYSANRMVNGNAVELPGMDSPPEKWNEFAGKLRGESIKEAKDYKFNFGKDAENKDIAPNPKLLGFAQQLAYDLGVPPKRAQEMIVDRWQALAKDINTEAHNAAVAANEQEANAVKATWGANFDTLRAAGERAVKALGLSQADVSKIEGAIGASAVMNLFAKLGQASAEGGLPSGDPSKSSDPAAMTPQAAQVEIDRMRNDPEISKALNDKTHSQHKHHTDRMSQLYQVVAGAKQPA